MRPTLRLLDEELIQTIIVAAYRILHDVGVEVRGTALRQRLQDHGLAFDATSGRISFPPDVVDAAVNSAPASITLFDRDGAPCAVLGGNNVHFTPGSSALNVLDHRTGEKRPAVTRDFVEYVRVADGLEHLAYLATAFSTEDVAPAIADAWRLYLCLLNSRKGVVSGAFTEHGVPLMARMMALFRRDRADLVARPFSIFTVTATGHFRYGEDSCQNLLDCVEWGIPVEVVPVTLMGLIAPVTLVEAAAFHTADVLAGVTMSQIIRPGAPVLFGGAPAVFHMQAATSPMAAIEAQRLNVAFVAVGKALNLPTQAYMALGDGKTVDAQAGAETFSSAILAALAGVNSVSGPGLLDFLLTFSLEKLVLDDDLCAQALHFIRPVKAADDSTAVGLAQTLLEEQHLLTADHTLAHWEEQLFLPGPVIDRQNGDAWMRAGCPSLRERARSEVTRRLAAYRAVETDAAVVGEMRRLLNDGMTEKQPLPAVPPPEEATAAPLPRRRWRRRS